VIARGANQDRYRFILRATPNRNHVSCGGAVVVTRDAA
jgi:hypothetical protein